MSEIYLDHVAIAVNKDNMDNIKNIYQDLGFNFSKDEEVKSEKVNTSFAKVDQNTKIELLEPTDSSSPIDKYISKKGAGIHHLCFKVKDLDKKISELSKLGYHFIYETPKQGAHGTLVNFIHPKSAGGVLIELNQDQK